MASFTELDIQSVARIGLLFLEGDSLEDVLLDQYGHTDYDFDHFNLCKIALMRIERINPTLSLTAVLWQPRPDNGERFVPVVAGNALPLEGYQPSSGTEGLRAAMAGGFDAVTCRAPGCDSHYFPVRNSDGEIVGALELLWGNRPKVDI